MEDDVNNISLILEIWIIFYPKWANLDFDALKVQFPFIKALVPIFARCTGLN